MLRNYFSPHDDIDVVVLDFDLSWHRDSVERSIYPKVEGALGYGAPEQFSTSANSRTRSALVDCFGLGMTMFYMATGRHPNAREQDSVRWEHTLRNDIALQPCAEWNSVPYRYARLIRELSQSVQEQRLDFSLAEIELNRIRATIDGSDVSASVVAEELMHRVIEGSDYNWANDDEAATTGLSSGTFRCAGDEILDSVLVSFQWSDTGDRNRRQLPQQLRAISEFSRKRLSESGWSEVSTTVSGVSLEMAFEISVSSLTSGFDVAVDALQQTRAKFSF
jgi:serine/threonine protein kinase